MGCNCNKSKVTSVSRRGNVQTVHVKQHNTAAQSATHLPSPNAAKRVITRNPNHNGNLFWVSEWAAVVVALNGVIQDPSTFIYANENGWIDKIREPLKLNRLDTTQGPVPETERVKGQVMLKFFSPNHCQDCRRAMKSVNWWEPQFYTNNVTGTIQAAEYTDAQLEEFANFRQQVWDTIKE